MSRKGVPVLGAPAIYAVLLIAFGSIPVFVIGFVIVDSLGATDAIGTVMRQTVALLGRASSAHSFAAMGPNNVGQVEVAFMPGAIGAGPTKVMGGLVAIVVVRLVWRLVPGVRNYRYDPDAERAAANKHRTSHASVLRLSSTAVSPRRLEALKSVTRCPCLYVRQERSYRRVVL
jgi:hypothetical protein